MLTVTGEASFANEGKELKMTVRIQPHTPQEHDMLARIAPMTDGQLAFSETVNVPSAQIALQEGSGSAETPTEATEEELAEVAEKKAAEILDFEKKATELKLASMKADEEAKPESETKEPEDAEAEDPGAKQPPIN